MRSFFDVVGFGEAIGILWIECDRVFGGLEGAIGFGVWGVRSVLVGLKGDRLWVGWSAIILEKVIGG